MNKHFLKFMTTFLVIIVSFPTVACKNKPGQETIIAVTGITLNKTIVTLEIGETLPLEATIKPENATNLNVSWSSTNGNVASFDTATGLVTALESGSAMITVVTEDGNFHETCFVTVNKPSASGNGFVKTSGSVFIDGNGNEIVFKGGGQWIGAGWNSNTYAKLANIGFNSVRLYLDARNATLSDPTNLTGTTLSVIDNNIAMARQRGMTIILNIHMTPGASGISDRGFFTNADRPQRLAAVWKAIAMRYKDEPVIAGYDIINEPTVQVTPVVSPYRCDGSPYLDKFANYQKIIQDIVNAIREVDMNHTIIAERLWIDGGHYSFGIHDQRDCWQNYDGKFNFPDIDDPAGNYAYTYHCYEPNTYCHQVPRTAVYPSGATARYNEINPATGQSWTYSKAYLDYAYSIPLHYIRNIKNVPAYIGELGILPYNYDYGGAQYMEDLYDLLLHKYQISNSFHPYHIGEFHPVFDPDHEAAFRKAFGTK